MKAEISHHGYRDDRHYTGVYLQQGTMITDRDFNALCDRLRHQLATASDRFAGPGTPRRDGLITGMTRPGAAPEWEARFSPTGGWVGADGVYALALPTEGGPFSYQHQPDLPNPPALTPGMLYADIWDDVVTAYDAPDLVDPGLHGAHTAFVRRRRVQIKQCDIAQLVPTACGLQPDPALLPAIGTGAFKVAFREGVGSSDPCDPCAEVVDVDRVIGNYLLRVEIHDVQYQADGTPIRCVVKWSSENGAIQYPRDDTNRPLEPGFVYEYFNDDMPLYMGLPAGGMTDRPPRATLLHAGETLPPAGLDRVRRWDGYATLNLSTPALVEGRDRDVDLFEGGTATAHGHVAHSNGVFSFNLAELTLSLTLAKNGSRPPALLTGDYWLALARSRAAGPEIRALSTRPIGIRHHYCVLGGSTDGRTFVKISAADKRRLSFPDLTCLGADDIAYDTDNCQIAKLAQVASVQDALDEFCARLHPYNVLRMSQGTGQEGPLNAVLPGPIEAIVEDRDGRPVSGAQVMFRVLTEDGGGNLAGRLDSSATGVFTRTEIEVTSDSDGRVQVFWRLTGVAGLHQVEASLLNSLGKRAPHLIYAARTETQAQQNDLPIVTKLEWLATGDFKNDAPVDANDFAKGLAIEVSAPLAHPELVTGDVLTFTAEYFLNDDRFFNFQPLILCGTVQADGNRIVFEPNPRSLEALMSQPVELPDCAPAEGMRIRLKLSGRFLQTEDGLLDGYLPGVADGTRIALNYDNPGLGHPSDLEAWFYLAMNRNGLKLYLIDDGPLAVSLKDIGGTAAQDFLTMVENAVPNADIEAALQATGADVDLRSGRIADPNRATQLLSSLRERGLDNVDAQLITTQELAGVSKLIVDRVRRVSRGFVTLTDQPMNLDSLRDAFQSGSASLILIDDDTRRTVFSDADLSLAASF